MGFPQQKGSAIEVGRVRRSVQGGSAVTEEVYNPWRFRLCEGARRSLMSTGLRQGQPSASDYNQLHPRILRRGGYCMGTRCARINSLGPFLKIVTDAMAIGALEARPFLRGQTINTRIICLLLNDRHFFVELRPGRVGLRNAVHSFRWSTCTATTQSTSDTYELTTSYIPKNISASVCAYAGVITDATPADVKPTKRMCLLNLARPVLKYVTRYR